MKLFLKKINRGVVLTLALVLVIVGYYVANEIKIAPEKEAITKVGKQFGEVYRQGKIRAGEYLDFVEYPETALEAHKNSVKAKLTELYIKDAPGIELWMDDFFGTGIIQNSAEYRSKFSLEFRKARNFKVSGDEASANFDFAVSSETSQKIANSDSVSIHLEEYTLRVSMLLVKSDNVWKASEISTIQYWY